MRYLNELDLSGSGAAGSRIDGGPEQDGVPRCPGDATAVSFVWRGNGSGHGFRGAMGAERASDHRMVDELAASSGRGNCVNYCSRALSGIGRIPPDCLCVCRQLERPLSLGKNPFPLLLAFPRPEQL